MGAAAPPPVATARPHGQQPRDRKVSPVELFYDLVGSCCSDEGRGSPGHAARVLASLLAALLSCADTPDAYGGPAS